MNTFFVIGFMGCGKSYWGKKWADLYGLSFYETDDLTEAAEGKTIAAIFEEAGEAYFRQKNGKCWRKSAVPRIASSPPGAALPVFLTICS
jgi:shikimate kinase